MSVGRGWGRVQVGGRGRLSCGNKGKGEGGGEGGGGVGTGKGTSQCASFVETTLEQTTL